MLPCILPVRTMVTFSTPSTSPVDLALDHYHVRLDISPNLPAFDHRERLVGEIDGAFELAGDHHVLVAGEFTLDEDRRPDRRHGGSGRRT